MIETFPETFAAIPLATERYRVLACGRCTLRQLEHVPGCILCSETRSASTYETKLAGAVEAQTGQRRLLTPHGLVDFYV